MIIDFQQIEEQTLPHFKGGDGELQARITTDGRVKIMQGRLAPGCSIGLHTHEGNSESLYLLEGQGTVCFDGAEQQLRPGQAHYCPMGHTHSLTNNGTEDLLFIAVIPEHS